MQFSPEARKLSFFSQPPSPPASRFSDPIRPCLMLTSGVFFFLLPSFHVQRCLYAFFGKAKSPPRPPLCKIGSIGSPPRANLTLRPVNEPCFLRQAFRPDEICSPRSFIAVSRTLRRSLPAIGAFMSSRPLSLIFFKRRLHFLMFQHPVLLPPHASRDCFGTAAFSLCPPPPGGLPSLSGIL